MKILSNKDIEAGKPFEAELSQEELEILLITGIRAIVEELGAPLIVTKVIPNLTIKKEHNLDDEEYQELINLGFNVMLQKHIQEEKNEKKI